MAATRNIKCGSASCRRGIFGVASPLTVAGVVVGDGAVGKVRDRYRTPTEPTFAPESSADPRRHAS
jgi:hypothetical protein